MTLQSHDFIGMFEALKVISVLDGPSAHEDMYRMGQGTNLDYTEAKYWYQRLASCALSPNSQYQASPVTTQSLLQTFGLCPKLQEGRG